MIAETKTRGTAWGRRDWLFCVLLAAAAALLIWFITPEHAVFGSKTDWLSQHSVLAEYFRQSFYRTGVFFPEFAMELGGGQNVYNFSYYGLFNPIILISYLLPAVSMRDYLSAASAAEGISCAVLFYIWVRGKNISRRSGLVATLCFLCASPLLFHFHRQVMFVNYMPFLLLALIAMDRGAGKRRYCCLFCFSVLCCILTSYFFSVGCLAALLLYGAAELGEPVGDQARGQKRGAAERRFLGCGVLAIMLAAFLWVPTGLALLSGRESSGGAAVGSQLLSALRQFVPAAEPQWLLGGPYTLGLTWTALLALFVFLAVSHGRKRILPVGLFLLLIVPGLTWLLCGTLYTRPKGLIPFLPLYCLLIARLVQRVGEHVSFRGEMRRVHVDELADEDKTKWAFMSWMTSAGPRAGYLLLAGVIAVSSLLQCLEANGKENWAELNQDKLQTAAKEELLQYRENGAGLFRTDDLTYATSTVNQTYSGAALRTSVYSSLFNQSYSRFCTDIMENARPARNRMISASTQNLFFQAFMGVRYLLSEKGAPAGYEKVSEQDGVGLYENKKVLPLGWAGQRTASLKELEGQQLSDRIQTLFECIVVEEDGENAGKTEASGAAEPGVSDGVGGLTRTGGAGTERSRSGAEKSPAPWFHQLSEQELLFGGQGGFPAARPGETVRVPLNEALEDKILLIELDVRDLGSDRDITVSINGITNKLSKKTAPYPNGNTHFAFVLSDEQPIKELKIAFGQGQYQISDVTCSIMEESRLWEAIGAVDRFQADEDRSADNRIAGNIQVSEDGWFATSIPYDKGFEIKVDGEAQAYFRVNSAFLGFPIKKGEHEIELVYHAPGRGLGMAISLTGTVIGLFLLLRSVSAASVLKFLLSMLGGRGRGRARVKGLPGGAAAFLHGVPNLLRGVPKS